VIILSGVLVVVAIALLVAGIVAGSGDSAQVLGLDALVVIYISIAVSLVSFVCLAIGVFLRRKELFGAVPAPAAPARKARSGRKDAKKDKKDKKKAAKGERPAPDRTVPAKSPAPVPDDDVEIPLQPANVPDDALVYVVRGRRRYHLDTCRQLAGRDKEELTYVEAKEEGFSPCTACMPDTALAARAAVSVPVRSGAQGGSASKTAPKSAGKTAGKPASETAGETAVGLTKSPPAAKTAEFPGGEPGIDDAAPYSSGRQTRTDLPVPGRSAAPRLGDPADAGGSPSAPPSAWPLPTSPRPSGEPESPQAADETADAPVEAVKPEPAAPDTPAAEADHTPAAEDDSQASTITAPLETPHGPDSAEEAWDAPSAAEDASLPDLAASTSDPLGPSDPSGPSVQEQPQGDEGPQVRILSGTKRYHRVDCALIEDIGDEAEDLEALSRAEAMARGCTPCLVCQPDDD
jgi:hypothetical protein